jgi:hypothetical protein
VAASFIRAVNGPMMGICGGKTYALVFVDNGTDLVEMRVAVQGEDYQRTARVGRLNVARYLDEHTDEAVDDALRDMLLGTDR